MQNTYPMTLTTPKLNTKLTIEKLDGYVVMSIDGFGRWLLEDEGELFFAIGFLPADEQTLEFESLPFFWHDWMDDLMNTPEFYGYTLQYQCAMHYMGQHINVEFE